MFSKSVTLPFWKTLLTVGCHATAHQSDLRIDLDSIGEHLLSRLVLGGLLANVLLQWGRWWIVMSLKHPNAMAGVGSTIPIPVIIFPSTASKAILTF